AAIEHLHDIGRVGVAPWRAHCGLATVQRNSAAQIGPGKLSTKAQLTSVSNVVVDRAGAGDQGRETVKRDTRAELGSGARHSDPMPKLPNALHFHELVDRAGFRGRLRAHERHRTRYGDRRSEEPLQWPSSTHIESP